MLDEPAPVDGEVPVIVSFPDSSQAREEKRRTFRWEEARANQDGYEGSLADQVIRQRREERF